MEELINRLLDELYFPVLPVDAAVAADISIKEAFPILRLMQVEELLRREDHSPEPLNEQTLLVATKKGLLRSNGMG